MTEKPKCSKCGEEMVDGFILDADHTANLPAIGTAVWFTQARWVAGKPEGSLGSGIKWSDKEAYRIAAYRCPSCGLLELHAMEPSKYPEFP
jgi:hypothetical protein